MIDFDEYLKYLIVSGELDQDEVNDLIREYNNKFGELDDEFFNLDLNKQKELLVKALKYNVKIIKK